MSQTPPLFIVGAPRSGNTLTRRVLMASDQIYIPPETYVLGEILSRWRKWGGLNWRERVFLFCAYFDRHNLFADLEIDSLTPFAKQACALEKRKQTRQHLIDLFYAFMTREHGYTAPRWGDKTPWKLHQNYAKDLMMLRYGKVDGQGMVFTSKPAARPATAPRSIAAE